MFAVLYDIWTYLGRIVGNTIPSRSVDIPVGLS